MIGIEIVLLFVVGWLLKRKPTSDEKRYITGIVLTGFIQAQMVKTSLGNAVSAFVFYLVFWV